MTDSGGLAELVELVLAVARDMHAVEARDPQLVALTASEVTVLRYIHRRPGLTPSAVARGTGMQRSNLSTAIRALERQGLIARAQGEADGRTVTLTATALADENLARLQELWARRVRTALDGEIDRVDEAIAVLRGIDEGLLRMRAEARPVD